MPGQTSNNNAHSEPSEPRSTYESLYQRSWNPSSQPRLPGAPRLTTLPSPRLSPLPLPAWSPLPSPVPSRPASPIPWTLNEPDSLLQSWSSSSFQTPPRSPSSSYARPSTAAISQFLVEPRSLPDVPHARLNRPAVSYEAIRALPPMVTLSSQVDELWHELANNYENAVPADIAEAMFDHRRMFEQVELLSLFDSDESPEEEALPNYSLHLQPGERRVSPPPYRSWESEQGAADLSWEQAATMDMDEYVAIRDYQAGELLDNITELKRRSRIGAEGVETARSAAWDLNRDRRLEFDRVRDRNSRERGRMINESLDDMRRRSGIQAGTVDELRQQLKEYTAGREGRSEENESSSKIRYCDGRFVSDRLSRAEEEERQLEDDMVEEWYEHMLGLDLVHKMKRGGRKCAKYGVVCKTRGDSTLCFVSWEGARRGVWVEPIISQYEDSGSEDSSDA
ncbi:MAG: hypothetical protein Q9160_002532 [Pyrenula sp. 1 TL-2023]